MTRALTTVTLPLEGVSSSDQDERGFTLIELLTVITVTAILLTLGASALRHYWLTQALDGSAEEVVSQLRQLQQRTDSESHPIVYGARFDVGTGSWAVVRYDPVSATTPDDDVCSLDSTQAFSDGIVVSSADFADPPGLERSRCPGSSQEFVFFYARGTATGGSVTLRHNITTNTETVSVLPLTGRVRRA
jgi:prepilin-type N-terminal cleavage/methylation domain-containing protein